VAPYAPVPGAGATAAIRDRRSWTLASCVTDRAEQQKTRCAGREVRAPPDPEPEIRSCGSRWSRHRRVGGTITCTLRSARSGRRESGQKGTATRSFRDQLDGLPVILRDHGRPTVATIFSSPRSRSAPVVHVTVTGAVVGESSTRTRQTESLRERVNIRSARRLASSCDAELLPTPVTERRDHSLGSRREREERRRSRPSASWKLEETSGPISDSAPKDAGLFPANMRSGVIAESPARIPGLGEDPAHQRPRAALEAGGTTPKGRVRAGTAARSGARCAPRNLTHLANRTAFAGDIK